MQPKYSRKTLHGFNSKLVRLEVEFARRVASSYSEFQFQTGSIRRKQARRTCFACRCFNSKLVRLEDHKIIDTRRIFTFQFQTGSIRRLSKNYINIILYPYSSCQVNFSFAIKSEAVCCRPLIAQILWEVDGTMCEKGLSAILC